MKKLYEIIERLATRNDSSRELKPEESTEVEVLAQAIMEQKQRLDALEGRVNETD